MTDYYLTIFMTPENNKRMLLGKTVPGSFIRLNPDDMEIRVGEYRVKFTGNYPYVDVRPAE